MSSTITTRLDEHQDQQMESAGVERSDALALRAA